MLPRNHREGPSPCGRELPGEGVLSTQTPDSRAGLLPTEVITARQAQSHVQNMVDDSVSKDTRMTSKRGWARSAQEGGGGGVGESGMSCTWSPSGHGLAHTKLPLARPCLAPSSLRYPWVVLVPRVELGLPEAWSGPGSSPLPLAPLSLHLCLLILAQLPGLWPLSRSRTWLPPSCRECSSALPAFHREAGCRLGSPHPSPLQERWAHTRVGHPALLPGAQRCEGCGPGIRHTWVSCWTLSFSAFLTPGRAQSS